MLVVSSYAFLIGAAWNDQPTPPKPNTQPTAHDAPKAQPNALADSVTVRAGIVPVRQWMASGKAKG